MNIAQNITKKEDNLEKKMKQKLKTISMVGVLSLLMLFSIPIKTTEAQDITLYCPCNCGDQLENCGCANAKETRSLIEAWRDNGLSESNIADKYAQRFGESFVQTGTGEPKSNARASEIEKNLICSCGCGDVVKACTCETASQIHSWVTSQVERGVGSEDIYLNS